MFNIVKLLVFIALCSSTNGRLVQVAADCSNDAVQFWCTNEMGYLIWKLRTAESSIISLTFYSGSPVGSQQNHTLNMSSISGQLTFRNGSFINTSVTITSPINLNGGTISCNVERFTLYTPTMPSSIPTSINLSKNEQLVMLVVRWSHEGNGYCIQVSTPTEVDGNWKPVTNASITLPLLNITYEVRISLLTDKSRTSNFTIGPCIFRDFNTIGRNYILHLNDSWSIFQDCDHSNTLFHTTCDSHGRWSTEITCPRIKNGTAFVTDHTAISYSTEDTEDGLSCTPESTRACGKMVSVSIGVSVFGTFVITLIIGLLVSLLCGIKYKEKCNISKQSHHLSEEDAMTVMKAPLYEEVKLGDEGATIDLSQNIAYGQTTRTVL